MLGLALDSAAELASASLWRLEGDPSTLTISAFAELSRARGKADQLILGVEDLLKDGHLAYQDLDVIAVNRGPGSFTGIRSAVALARGLALALQRPVIGVTGHEAIALAIGPDQEDGRSLMVAENARRGEVYRQIFDARLRPLDEICAERPDMALSAFDQGRWRLAGTGASMIEQGLDEQADVEVMPLVPLDARAVARAAAHRLAAGDRPTPGFSLQPLYIRPPDAAVPRPLIAASPRPGGADV